MFISYWSISCYATVATFFSQWGAINCCWCFWSASFFCTQEKVMLFPNETFEIWIKNCHLAICLLLMEPNLRKNLEIKIGWDESSWMLLLSCSIGCSGPTGYSSNRILIRPVYPFRKSGTCNREHKYFLNPGHRIRLLDTIEETDETPLV